MSKQQITIEVDVPEGWEITKVADARLIENTNLWVLESGKPAEGRMALHVEVAKAWQWPSWLKAEWIALDSTGIWFAFNDEPDLQFNRGVWTTDTEWQVLKSELLHFTPPPCTDWRQSKRRRPS